MGPGKIVPPLLGQSYRDGVGMTVMRMGVTGENLIGLGTKYFPCLSLVTIIKSVAGQNVTGQNGMGTKRHADKMSAA